MIHTEYWLIIELNINFLYIYKKISKFYLQFIYNGVPYLNDDQVCMKNSMDIRHNCVNYRMAFARVWNLLHVSLSPCQNTPDHKNNKLDNKMNASRYKKSFYQSESSCTCLVHVCSFLIIKGCFSLCSFHMFTRYIATFSILSSNKN